MENRGVLLYVDLGRLEDEPYRLSKIYDTLGQYIDDIRRQRDIIYISKMAESLDISSLDRYRAQLVDEYDRLGTLKKILDEAYDLYKECNEKFEASGQTLCNLYAETPWYETSEGKLAIGIGVLVVTAAVAIVCPAVLGAAAATVTQSIATSAIIGAATSGVMNGIASMKSGKSFYDGFANGFESGAILGAISGGLGAGTSAIMSGAELTVGRVMAVKAMNMVSDATVDTVVYAYHSNKYDKDFTGGDIVKTWVKSAATSFAMQSVGGGKSSSKAESENGVISTGKGQGGGGGNVNWKNGKKTVDVNGKTVTMDKNTFDPGFVDKQGRTNTQRMEQGLAPIGTDGKSVNIHHIDQTDNGPVMEITATEHQQNYSKLHTNIGQAPSKINRSKFNKWRREYWKWRSNNLD
ncbi:HNH/ENDO VII family nuclease [Coprococcus sp. RTP21428st1_C9_RTP21428_210409]|uniref:HNH/ENDO VII family nuclease n=2 Tax=Coprococcus TaxID=33042 RepID=UPI0032F09A72